jgi:phosphohistidine swiveling domain-containing protein
MTMTSIPAGNGIVSLEQLGRMDAPHVGSKAANLGELARLGLPVPPGAVLLPGAGDAALDVLAALLGDVPLAVRSSGVAEDLADASFAGQYETVLDVRGPEQLREAVRRCRESASSARVVRYRSARVEQPAADQMAVLVQRFVRADAAGVAFTSNPVTGARDETLVSAVRGLGERLVSGQADPDEWVVKGDRAECRRAPESALDEAQVRSIVDLASRVEAHFGQPQDIEWAIECGVLWLLQARPITALPEPIEPVPVVPPPGFWEREASHAPQPWTPLFRSALFGPRNAALKRMFDEFGFLAESLECQEIGGWEYIRLVPLGGKDRPAPPPWAMPLLVRLVPQMRNRIAQSVAAMRADKPARFIERWHHEWQLQFATRIAELRDESLASIPDAAVDEHIARTIRLVEDGFDAHFLLHGAVGIQLAAFAFACRDILGWEEQRAFEMLNGLSEKSTEPARRLAELAHMAAKRPAVRSLLEQVDDRTIERVAEADRDFAAAFETYLREYGCRCLRYEIADSTVAETPTLLLHLIRDQLARRFDPSAQAAALSQQRAAAVAAARVALTGRPAADGQRFERALARAERAYPVREDNEFYTMSAPLALLRYAVLELGRRLADWGSISRCDDVFFLEIAEARPALREGSDRATGVRRDLRALVARRKGERAWVAAHPGPASYGTDPGPPPSFRAVPPEARLAMEALLWAVDRIFAAEQSQRSQAAGAVVGGIPASAGRYTGPVRVIMGEHEFKKLQAGDVLVCPITSPVWSVLFPSVGALVTDTGGILSHPAIIAREYRVPAVVATGNATRLLHDGQLVTVDGARGIVALGA